MNTNIIGQRLVNLKGTGRYIWRVVFKNEDTGLYFIRLKEQFIQVSQRWGDENSTGDWQTVGYIDTRR